MRQMRISKIKGDRKAKGGSRPRVSAGAKIINPNVGRKGGQGTHTLPNVRIVIGLQKGMALPRYIAL